MKFFSLTAVAASLALCAFSVQAQEENVATISISPSPDAVYKTLPTEFVVNVEGPVSFTKNTWKNTLKITSPNGTTVQFSGGTVSGNSISISVNSSRIPIDQNGDYTVEVQSGALKYTWADGSTSSSDAATFIYKVDGESVEIEDPDVKKPVQYDITLKSTLPNLQNINLDMLNINDGVQINFSQSELLLDPDANAMVTIKGPNYNISAPLTKNGYMPNFIVRFPAELVYSGDYTLTIPQGVVGDNDWIEDHAYGHANAAIEYKFTAINGQDPSEITKDLTFNPSTSPAQGKVNFLKRVTLEFDSKPYWNPETTLEVTYQTDLSQETYNPFGTATIERGLDNKAILVIEPTPTEGGEYVITLPEGIFWDAAHETDHETGSMNGELQFKWNFQPQTVTVTVTGHTPKDDELVAAFKAGEIGIVIQASNNAAVDKMEVEVTGYKMNDDMAMPETVVEATSTYKNEKGEICWVNETGKDIKLVKDYYYEVSYTLYSAEGSKLTDGSFEFYGDASTGVTLVESDNENAVVFNTQGVRIDRAVKELPAGLYIINGSKIVIR